MQPGVTSELLDIVQGDPFKNMSFLLPFCRRFSCFVVQQTSRMFGRFSLWCSQIYFCCKQDGTEEDTARSTVLVTIFMCCLYGFVFCLSVVPLPQDKN
jgi:hypothetical protein